ncbi:chemotaxis protein CheR [Pusillimonas sp. T2]|nr:chemotaxis protein CheR [Pusillimonas sp. T2]
MTPAVLPVAPEEFERATRLLHQRTGIVVGEHKREMATRTLSLRARKLGANTVSDYLGFLQQNPDGPEWEDFVNAFTINHTAFFREQHHFETLRNFVKGRRGPINIWCCASSTGEEPYSIAMTLQESVPNASSQASIWATDIDTQAIARAQKGVYTLERVKTVPEPLLRKYFLRGKDAKSGLVRVKPLLQDMIKFEPLNLLAPKWPTDKKFDAIFCRNTMIYFDKETQTKILDRFAPMLKPDGLLFAGHSENFTYLTKAFKLQGQTVYVVVR